MMNSALVVVRSSLHTLLLIAVVANSRFVTSLEGFEPRRRRSPPPSTTPVVHGLANNNLTESSPFSASSSTSRSISSSSSIKSTAVARHVTGRGGGQGIVVRAVGRGGGGRGGSTPALTADYSSDARTLFSNVIGPAAMLAGSLVPLGFLAPPLVSSSENNVPLKNWNRLLGNVYALLSVLSLCNQITAIVYATVALNKLVEVPSAATVSVFELIQRDYELSWIATNVHFLCGLFGFMGMIGIRTALCSPSSFPTKLRLPATGLCVAALLMCASVVNHGVAKGDGSGTSAFGSNIMTLVGRYMTLLIKEIQSRYSLTLLCGLVLGIVSLGLALRAVVVF